jgi:cellulose synthase (UDP-forming)
MSEDYFTHHELNFPGTVEPISARRQAVWQLLAGMTVGFSAWYLVWRWTQSLNPDALAFSIVVALAESLLFVGTCLFFHDIWREQDNEALPLPQTREEAGVTGSSPVSVDILITTYDEDPGPVSASVEAARQLSVPDGVVVQTWVCDDGNRQDMAAMARAANVGYLTRTDNRGYKAGNLRQAMFATTGDFIVICDADTRLLPGFLANTLGYFRDPEVAWVQTPHWFYDIPQGEKWASWLMRRFGSRFARLGPAMRAITGRDRVGSDPFLADPTLFFDVIQRRRNRNGASFCCGAGSIHRREAVFQGALRGLAKDISVLKRRTARRGCLPWRRSSVFGDFGGPWWLGAVEIQPFRFHVSEDLLTSIWLHSDPAPRWRSVFHPQPESRMLSVRSLKAWSLQRLKYAGGTFDIMLRDNPLFRRGMPWRVRLHYAATFWSYLSAIWTPVLIFAPAVSLALGVSPVSAYSWEFFSHLIPMLIANEAAMLVTCKGHGVHQGRILSMAGLPIQWRALVSVLRGRRPQFPVTPKSLGDGGLITYLWPNLAILGLLGLAGIIGLGRFAMGDPGVPLGSLVTNMFWIAVNAIAVGWILPAAFSARDGKNAIVDAIPLHERDVPNAKLAI